jgi:hypothetical protein
MLKRQKLKRPQNKMRWVKQKIRDWLYSDEIMPEGPDRRSISSDGLFTLEVHNANGGKILEFRRNDPKLDHYVYQLYIIKEEDDFNVEAAKIISLEIMKS